MTEREAMISFVRDQLQGPWSGEDEVLSVAPGQRYTLGLLFPVDPEISIAAANPDESLDDSPLTDCGSSDDTTTNSAEDPIALSAQTRPSSMGLSVVVDRAARITAIVSAGAYSPEENGTWQRRQLTEAVENLTFSQTPKYLEILGGRAKLHVRWRKVGSGDRALVTATIVNAKQGSKPEDVLAQCALRLETATGESFLPYPAPALETADPEEAELRLRYLQAPAYAVGHGCAATWEFEATSASTIAVQTDSMPTYTVPAITAGSNASKATDIAWLADEAVPLSALSEELRRFIDDYAEWAGNLEEPGNEQHLPAFSRIKARIEYAIHRMRTGLKLLETDSDALRAFRLAQRAMYLQMSIQKGDLRSGEGGTLASFVQADRFRWFPFQLAYQLLTLRGITSADAEDRGTVDLLWFPTGGGKTEAYLSLAAYTVFLRRIQHGHSGEGTAVVTRYTLRLLTEQQFQRYARLAAACELLRRENPGLLGTQPIRVGLWVGASRAAPNTFDKAAATLSEALSGSNPSNPFQLAACPLCGTELVQRKSRTTVCGFKADGQTFSARCINESCDFANEIPVVFVDDQIYKDPPSFLVGTIDKFARLAWEPRSGALITPDDRLPPSLIIQDELHLLSGPLGTVAGLYEAGIALAIAQRHEPPKVIASTATIRRADEQCRALFNSDVAIFPPPGPSADDSFFATVHPPDETRAGRTYVGVMAQSHTPTMSFVRTVAALAQAPVTLKMSGAILDAYWTVVAYHNSLRELGLTLTAARDDIPYWIREFAPSDEDARPFLQERVLELTSNAVESPDALLRQMERSLTGEREADASVVDFIACTNMLSVGVDVARLGVMIVNGQPKTTAEYIQATSRVGRAADRPGLVIAHYSATKPRDRSHYENFTAYHQALYRHVEPTSVTPFSLPAQDRALHAAMVILVRYGLGYLNEEDAGRIALESPDDLWLAGNALIERARDIDPTEAEHTAEKIAQIIERWTEAAQLGQVEQHPLVFDAKKTPHRSLLRRFDSKIDEGFKTLDSMRNVDASCRIDVGT